MSQVIRKYQSGKPIKLEADKLFERQGFGSYKRDDIAKKLAQGVESYISNNNMNEKDAKAFRDVVSQAIQGVQNGQFVKMDTQGIHNTMNLNSNGLTENKRFLGIDTGRQRSFEKSASTDDGKNNALNELNKFFAQTLDSMSTYDYDKELQEYNSKNPKQKYNANTFLTDAISREWYGGNNIDWNNFSQNRTEQERRNLIGSIFNNANYEDLFNKYDWEGSNIKNAQDLANLFKSFGTNITNGTIDNNDYNTFAALGGKDLNQFLHGVNLEENPSQTDPRKAKEEALREEAKTKNLDEETTNKYVEAGLLEYDRQKSQESSDIDKNYNKELFKNYIFEFLSKYPFKSSISGYVPTNVSYSIDTIMKGIGNDADKLSKYITNNLNKDYFSGKLQSKDIQTGQENTPQHLANNLDLAIKFGGLDDLGNGVYGIPTTYDFNNYTYVGYNPATHQYQQYSMLENAPEAIFNKAFEYWKNSFKKKDGGILIFQQGGITVNKDLFNKYQVDKINRSNQEEQRIKETAKQSNRTEEEIKAGQRKPATQDDWEYEDWARLISAGADVGSMITSFVPVYGTIASAGLGLGSTLGNLTADLADESVSWKSALGNAVLGLGMDVIGLVPGFGAAGKGSKIVRNLAKIAPKLLTIWGVGTAYEPSKQALNKLINKGASEMTVDDWKALSSGLTAAAGLTRWGAGYLANKRYTNKYGTKTYDITTKSGKQITATEEEYNNIRNAKGIKAQNEALRKIKGAENEELQTSFKKLYNPKRLWQGTPDVDKHITINKESLNRITPDGKVLTPNKLSNKGIWEWTTNNSWGHNWKEWKIPERIKNMGYSEVKKVETPTNKNALVPIGKRNEHTEFNKQVQDYERNWRQREADRINQNRLKIDDSRDRKAGIIPREGSISKFEGVDPKQVRAANKIGFAMSKIAEIAEHKPIDKSKLPTLYSKPVIDLPEIKTFIEGPMVPKYKGITEGLERVKKQRLADDIENARIERSVQQNTETIARKQIEDTKKNVDKAVALVTASRYKRPLQGAPYKYKQTMYNKLFNQKKYDMEEALRNKPLPHKNSNKKKKTSRDNNIKRREFGGIIFKDGGLIPKYLGGNVMQRGVKGTWLNNNNTFKDATDLNSWDSYYDINGIINDITKSGTLSSSNADDWVKTANQLSSMNLPWNKQLNAKGYNDWNTLYSSTGLNTYFGEDKGRFDYLGPSTWNRRLLLQELGNRYNSMDNPLSVGQDKVWYDNGTWKKVVPQNNEIPTPQAAPQTPVQPVKTSLIGTATPSKNKMPKISVLPEDVLALGRMVGGLAVNNRAAKLYKEGLKPTLLDTFENTVPLQGNSQAKYSANNQASSLYSMASKPRTSDASLQLAGELEATNKARQLLFQGDLADSEMFYKTRMLGQQESDAAKARRVEVANKNRVALNAIDQAKKQIDAGRITANYQQVLAPYLAGVENQFRQNRAMKNQLAMEQYLNNSRTAYDAELTGLQSKYKDNEIEFNRQRRLLDDKYSKEILNKRKQLIESPWLIQLSKSGSKLTYKERAALQRAKDFNKRLLDDNKQFHKDIMESKREHNKLIVNLSKLTAELIKKGMQL